MYKIIQPSFLKGNKMTQPSYSIPEDDILFLGEASSPYGKRLLDQYRDALRVKRYSPRTEDAYTLWVKKYILYHNKRHPKEMGVPEIGQFLTHLVSGKEMSASRHTAPAAGAGETRRSAPSSFSIVTSCTSNSINSP